MLRILSLALVAAAFTGPAFAKPDGGSIHSLTITDEDTRIHCNDGSWWDAKEEMCIADQSR